MNLSCRTAEFPLTAGGGNSDGRQKRRKGVGFRLYNHPPRFSFSRYEDRERRRGNGAGGCRQKGKCPGESVRSPGHYCVGIHAGIGRCQGLVGTGTDALPWVAATRRKGGSRLFRISWWGFAAVSPKRLETCGTERSCPFGRSRPAAGVLAVPPLRFIAPSCLPCRGAVGLEGDAPGLGIADLVAAGEVDGAQEALRSG